MASLLFVGVFAIVAGRAVKARKTPSRAGSRLFRSLQETVEPRKGATKRFHGIVLGRAICARSRRPGPAAATRFPGSPARHSSPKLP